MLGICGTHKRVNHILGSQFVAIGHARERVEKDAFSQLEGPYFLVAGDRPGFRQVGFGLHLVAGRIPDQTIKNRVHSAPVDGCRGPMRVQAFAVPGVKGDR